MGGEKAAGMSGARTPDEVLDGFLADVAAAAAKARVELRRARPQGQALTIRQAAKAYGIARTTLYEEVSSGAIKTVLPAGRTRGARIMREEMDRWMRSIGA